jgi:hypothetical protein
MAEIEMDAEGNMVTGTRALTIDEYAEVIGKSSRVVKRALYGEDSYEIPDAYKDQAGEWRIPENAVRVKRTQRPAKPEGPVNGLQVVPAGGFPAAPDAGAQLVPYQPPLETEPTLRESLDDKPGFLSIADAAEHLGIPEAQIRANPERFQLENVGYNGSPRVPQRVVRRIAGY